MSADAWKNTTQAGALTIVPTSKRKIVFIEPPPTGGRTPERLAGCSFELYHFPDLASLTLMALFHERGLEVDIVDAVLERLTASAFNLRLERLLGCDYVIHSVLLAKFADLQHMRAIYRRDPTARIFVHGPEPTRVPEEYLEHENTIVFRGEPEDNMLAFIEGRDAAGMSLRRNGSVVHVPPAEGFVDLDALPVPLRVFGQLGRHVSRYRNPKFRARPHTAMMASRGCAFRCFFCVPNSISFARELEQRRYFGGRKPRVSVASAARVVREFEQVARDGFRSVMVVDDQFLWATDRTHAICRGIRGLNLEWGMLSRADFLLDETVLAALREAGCTTIDIGVESLRQQTLDFLRKDLRVEQVDEALRLLEKHGISAKLNIMVGACPDERPSDIAQGVGRLRRLPVTNVMFSIATPFKGTEFYDFCQERGYLVDTTEEIDPLSKCVVSYPELTAGEIEKAHKDAYRSFYLRPKVVLRRLHGAQRWADLWSDFVLAYKLLK